MGLRYLSAISVGEESNLNRCRAHSLSNSNFGQHRHALRLTKFQIDHKENGVCLDRATETAQGKNKDESFSEKQA